MAREQEPPHRRACRRGRGAARSRASVSGLAEDATTSKIGGLAVLPVSAMRVSWARSTSLSPSSAARPAVERLERLRIHGLLGLEALDQERVALGAPRAFQNFAVACGIVGRGRPQVEGRLLGHLHEGARALLERVHHAREPGAGRAGTGSPAALEEGRELRGQARGAAPP